MYVAERYYAADKAKDGNTSIEQISTRYGVQAMVVSIDPRRQYVKDPADTKNRCVKTSRPGPNGEEYVWFQCTVKGGREGRDIGAYELAVAMEDLGCGEILLNCIDEDGQGNGFDHELVGLVSDAVTIPVIASSGAGYVYFNFRIGNSTDVVFCFQGTEPLHGRLQRHRVQRGARRGYLPPRRG